MALEQPVKKDVHVGDIECKKGPFDYILPYHVSIGIPSLTPLGSGTLVKFSICGGSITIYGILSAGHVALDLINHEHFKKNLIGLYKPSSRDSNTLGAKCSICLIYGEIDKSCGQSLMQNHKTFNSERDVAFIVIGINAIPKVDLFKDSEFYDLDAQIKPDLQNIDSAPLVLFRGACLDSEIKNETLKTGIHIVTKYEIKTYRTSKIIYYDMIYPSSEPLNGASGAGVWTFYRISDEHIKMLFRGIIVGQTIDYEENNLSRIDAIDLSYIQNSFFPKLKKYCHKLLYKTSTNNLLFTKYHLRMKSYKAFHKLAIKRLMSDFQHEKSNGQIYKIFTKQKLMQKSNT